MEQEKREKKLNVDTLSVSKMLHFNLPILESPACLESFDGHVRKLIHSHNEVLRVCSVSCHVQLCDPVDCSSAGSSVHGISQARILVCVAMPFSRESSQPRDRTQVSYTAGRFFTI